MTTGYMNPFDIPPSTRYSMNLTARFETANRVRDTVYMDTKMRACKGQGRTDMTLLYDNDFRTKQQNEFLKNRKRRILLVLGLLTILQISCIILYTKAQTQEIKLLKWYKQHETGLKEMSDTLYRTKRDLPSGVQSDSMEKGDMNGNPLLIRRLHNYKAKMKSNRDD